MGERLDRLEVGRDAVVGQALRPEMLQVAEAGCLAHVVDRRVVAEEVAEAQQRRAVIAALPQDERAQAPSRDARRATDEAK